MSVAQELLGTVKIGAVLVLGVVTVVWAAGLLQLMRMPMVATSAMGLL